MLAPSESLRPSGTSQYGPPTYGLEFRKILLPFLFQSDRYRDHVSLWLDRIVDSGTYQGSGITSCEGEDIGTGDSAWAGSLESSLDLVDHLKSPEGVPVRVGPFLTEYAAAVVQQHRSVTALHMEQCWKRVVVMSHMIQLRD